MASDRQRLDRGTKRMIWAAIAMVVVGGGAYVVTEVPPAQSEEQPLTTTNSPLSDYSGAGVVGEGTLHSDRSAGMRGELRTTVTYVVTSDYVGYGPTGPHLVARVFHDSGAVMVCKMGDTQNLRDGAHEYRLGCDRTVDFTKVDQWSTAELISCDRIEVASELFRDYPCRSGW